METTKESIKIKEEYKSNNISFSHTNYYSPFYLNKSDKDNNDNDDKDLIEILKEIERKKNVAILVKETRKKMRSINSEKQQLHIKYNTMKEQMKQDRAIMKSLISIMNNSVMKKDLHNKKRIKDMTDKQTEIWLTLHIAYNIIDRYEKHSIEKIANDQNKDLQKTYEELFKKYLESKKNSKELESIIICLQYDKIKVE